MNKIIIATLFFLASSITLFATDLSILVRDKDLDIPLEGVRIMDTEEGTIVYTDEQGQALLPIPASAYRVIILCELIGYTSRKILVKDFSVPLVAEMLMQGVLEGEELVIEEEAIDETDEKVGVSTVLERDVIQDMAKLGIIEDVMTAVQILPGVSYNGGFGATFSVRGGDPEGLTAIMDGFVVKYPYHWGGGFSIFNPNIVESVKFSAGIFSPKYGQATSGILEINTVNPTEGLQYSIINSLSTCELFLQLPIGSQFGILGGTRLTNYDLVFELTRSLMEEQGITFSRIPYIYDFYLKTFFRPHNRFEWYLNGFWGNDGIGVKTYNPLLDTDTEIATDFDFKYSNTDLFFNTGIKILPTDNLFIHLLGGYENWLFNVDGYFHDHGTRTYSDEFWEQWSLIYGLTDRSFTVDIESNFVSDVILHEAQFRADVDLALGPHLFWQNGLGAMLDFTDNSSSGTRYYITYGDNTPKYQKSTFIDQAEDNSIINSFCYTNFNWDIIPDTVNLELGCRVDHSYFISGEDYTLNTYPVPGPRMNLRFVQQGDNAFFEKNTWSLGVGLFAKTPFDSLSINEEMGLKDFDVAVPKTLMPVVGWETELPLGVRFKIEGYYKYIFDRFYYNRLTDEESGERELIIHNDGIGHAAGFDLLLDRRKSHYLDGIISYSFIYARYLNPQTDGIVFYNTPRGEWYYPYFHRFHTLNLMLNIKPFNWMTLTSKVSFATGTPRSDYRDKQMFPAIIVDESGEETVAEMYTRQTLYSDTLRNWISLPLDLKLAFHNYYTQSKVQWEFYLAVEDLLSPILAELGPKENIATNIYTGEETLAPSSDFSFIMISLGFKLSY